MQYLMNNVGDCKDKEYFLFVQENIIKKSTHVFVYVHVDKLNSLISEYFYFS